MERVDKQDAYSLTFWCEGKHMVWICNNEELFEKTMKERPGLIPLVSPGSKNAEELGVCVGYYKSVKSGGEDSPEEENSIFKEPSGSFSTDSSTHPESSNLS